MLFQKYCITSLHYEWQIVTTISNFYSKINKKCLATGLSPNPAGELRALPPKNVSGSMRGTCRSLANSLPIELQQCDSLGRFKRCMKTFLFRSWNYGAL